MIIDHQNIPRPPPNGPPRSPSATFILTAIGSVLLLSVTACRFVMDRVRPQSTNQETPSLSSVALEPTALVTSTPQLALITPSATSLPAPVQDPAARLWVFPGPEHYAGDLLTFTLAVPGPFRHGEVRVAYRIDSGQPRERDATWAFNPVYKLSMLSLPQVYDTSDQAGVHTLRVEVHTDPPLTFAYDFTVLPESGRPEQELIAEWEERGLECCLLHFISDTAAARDSLQLGELIQQEVEYVQERLGSTLRERADIVILDTAWGNGGYAGSESFVFNYFDRNYGPSQDETLPQILRHEMSHVLARNLLSNQAPTWLTEGLPVYIAGGHYKPEPLDRRAAALVELEAYIPLENLTRSFRQHQHEISYLEAGSLVMYFVDRFGWDATKSLLATQVEGAGNSWEWLVSSLASNFTITPEELEQGFLNWLQEIDPGEQVRDLQLTVDLQELRRRYQVERVPSYDFSVFDPVSEVEQMGILIRDSQREENVALETMMEYAQEALLVGDLDVAQRLIQSVGHVMNDQDAEDPVFMGYLEIVQLLQGQGYQVETLRVEGAEAWGEVIRIQPHLLEVSLMDGEDGWSLTSAP